MNPKTKTADKAASTDGEKVTLESLASQVSEFAEQNKQLAEQNKHILALFEEAKKKAEEEEKKAKLEEDEDDKDEDDDKEGDDKKDEKAEMSQDELIQKTAEAVGKQFASAFKGVALKASASDDGGEDLSKLSYSAHVFHVQRSENKSEKEAHLSVQNSNPEKYQAYLATLKKK